MLQPLGRKEFAGRPGLPLLRGFFRLWVRLVCAMSITGIRDRKVSANYPSLNEYFCELLSLRICCLIGPALTIPLGACADDATMAVAISDHRGFSFRHAEKIFSVWKKAKLSTLQNSVVAHYGFPWKP